jgi:antitoxin component of MazEF toxin-antitoxin module
MEKAAKPFQLKKVGGSLDVRLPRDFVHANELEPGDYVLLDFSKFKILKAEDFALLGREPVIENAEAT